MSEPNPNPPAPPPPEPEKITLTREDLDKLLEVERGKARRHAANDSALTAQERERLKALETEAAERAKAEKDREIEAAKAKGDLEKARELIIKSAQDEVIQKYEPELVKERERAARFEARIKAGLRDKLLALAGPWAYNATQVADLLEGRRVRLNDEFEPEVFDAAGQPALVGGKPMTLDQLVELFKAENPNLVKATGKPGGANGGLNLTPQQLTERGKLEEAVAQAEKNYRTTRNDKYLMEHRELSKKLKAIA